MTVLTSDRLPAADVIDAAPMAQRVAEAQLTQAYSRQRFSAIWSLLFVMLLVGWMVSSLGERDTWIWFGVLVGVQVLRYVGALAYWRFRRPGLPGSQQRWRGALIVGAGAAGLGWALGPLLIGSDADAEIALLLCVAVVSVSAVATTQLAPVFPALAVFTLAALGPTIAVMLLRGEPPTSIASVLMTCGLVMLWLSGRTTSRSNASMIRAEIQVAHSLERARRLAAEDARRSAELALEAQRLATILAATRAGVAEFDLRGGSIRVDRRLAEMLGEPAEALQGVGARACVERVHPADRAPLADDAQLLIGGRIGSVRRELRLAHADGHWVWVEVSAQLLARAADGSPSLASLTLLDVTARHQAEQRWRSRAEMSADWFWETDASYRVTLISDGVRHGLPFPHERLLGRTLAEIDELRPVDSGWGKLGQRLARHEAFSGFTLAAQAGGERRFIEIDGRPRFDDKGCFNGYEGVGRDVTERRLASDTLRESVALVDSLFEILPIPVVIQDRTGRYIRTNRIYRDLMEVPGTTVDHVSQAHDKAAAAIHQAVDDALLKEPGLRSYELRQTMNSGRVITGIFRKATFVGSDGEIRGLVTAMIDVSDERAAAEALRAARDAAEQASRAKSIFLATMSHELRTPLNAVIGAAQLLSLPQADPAQRAALIGAIENSGRALLGVIENVMDITRIESAELRLTDEPFDLDELVRSAVTTVRVAADAKGLSVLTRIDARVVNWRRGDPQRLQQVLLNLLGNAVKFTLEGEVAIEVDEPADGRGARFIVRDTGVGIDADQLGLIFEPFRQGESGASRRFAGAGLGLAIVRELVQAMGGEIAVSSDRGRGSRFEVRLPLPLAHGAGATGAVRRAAGPMVAAGTAAAPIGLAGRRASPRVLLVEDDPTNQVIMLAMLTSLGCAGETVCDGPAALRALRERPFDLVLMDWQMPDMDGLEVTRRVREGEAGPALRGVPIVAVTANAFAEDRRACLAGGMNDFVTKPVRLEVLRDAVMRWVPEPLQAVPDPDA